MAEFLTMDEAKSKFGTKGRTNAGLTLGIIGTALAAFAGNNGGCGCGNGGGILGNLFGGNNNCCAMQAAENAKTLAMAQGQQADNLSWANRVQSMQDDIDLYTYVNSRALATNERIGNESQVLTNQIWKGRVEDLQEKSAMYVDIVSRDDAQNLRLCDELYKRREQDVQEKADLFARLSTRISDLDIFTDVHGNINLELLANAVKAEMKEKSADGFVVNILNKPVRFGEDDVNQLVEIFKTFKQNN